MQPIGEIDSISHVIQLAVAPVFLLAGVGAMLNVLGNRLARTVDRARFLETLHEAAAGAEQERLRQDLRLQARRARMIYWAMGLCALCALLVCAVIVVQFANAFVHASFDVPVAVLFVAALLAMIGALLLFLREVHLATTNLRIGPP